MKGWTNTATGNTIWPLASFVTLFPGWEIRSDGSIVRYQFHSQPDRGEDE